MVNVEEKIVEVPVKEYSVDFSIKDILEEDNPALLDLDQVFDEKVKEITTLCSKVRLNAALTLNKETKKKIAEMITKCYDRYGSSLGSNVNVTHYMIMCGIRLKLEVNDHYCFGACRITMQEDIG